MRIIDKKKRLLQQVEDEYNNPLSTHYRDNSRYSWAVKEIEKNYLIVEVPLKSINHYINNVGCIRYEIGNMSDCITPQISGYYLTLEYVIHGTEIDNGKKYLILLK